MLTIEREMHGGGELFALIPKVREDHLEELPKDILELLQEFSQVLEKPTGVPPSQAFDHIIPLPENTALVNVRPYRYAHCQKNEIERQVSEMLATGLSDQAPTLFPHQSC